jgi:hypothetical protein
MCVGKQRAQDLPDATRLGLRQLWLLLFYTLS